MLNNRNFVYKRKWSSVNFRSAWLLEFLGLKRRVYWNDVYDDSAGMIREQIMKGFRQFARSTISSRRNIDAGVLICLARRKVNSSNSRFGDDELVGLNYHKKSRGVSVHVGICATIEMPAFFAAFNYSDALGRLNRLFVSLVKRNYEWRLRNSGITTSLGHGQVTDQLRVLLRQFLLESTTGRSGDRNRFYTAHSRWSSRPKRIHWTRFFSRRIVKSELRRRFSWLSIFLHLVL